MAHSVVEPVPNPYDHPGFDVLGGAAASGFFRRHVLEAGAIVDLAGDFLKAEAGIQVRADGVLR